MSLGLPMVSAVMPTRGRKEWALQALRSFLAQDYENKELVILDDEADPSFEGAFPEERENVRYYVSPSRLIPQKRNELCRLARGEFICSWDSDDWSAPGRISDQVSRLIDTGKAVTVYIRMLFVCGERVLEYRGSENNGGSGTSLMFRKSWWEKNPFPENVTLSTDMKLISRARDQKEVVCAEAGRLMVARVHPGNTNPKGECKTPSFIPVPESALPAGFPR